MKIIREAVKQDQNRKETTKIQSSRSEFNAAPVEELAKLIGIYYFFFFSCLFDIH